MAQITFNNGTSLTVSQNGTTYTAEITPEFPEDLTNITITGAEGTKTITNGLVVECYGEDEGYHFTIIEKPYQMLLEEHLQEQDDIICELLLTI